MGKFLTIPTSQIRPSQDFLKPQTVKFILKCIQNGNHGDLPPTPIIREVSENHYIAIDGHNLIAVRAYRHEPIEVYIADGPDDHLPGSEAASDGTRQRNQDLHDKFGQVVADAQAVAPSGILTFHDLVRKHPDIFLAK